MITEQDILKCRSTQIKLLDALKDICTKHNLRYWIDFGTLLGAVRNGKFIPWDDDIDVSMPIEDYNIFLTIAEKELPNDIFLQTPKTDKCYRQNFAKLRDCYSTYIEHHESEKDKYHKGIYLDIFPSVYYPRMPFFFRKVLLYFTVRSRHNVFVKKKKVFINFIIYALCKTIWFLFSPFKTNECAQTPEDNGYYYSIPDNLIYPLKKTKFENNFYNAPNNPYHYLELMYGKNYMSPPPEHQRIPHAKIILHDVPCEHPRSINKKTS